MCVSEGSKLPSVGVKYTGGIRLSVNTSGDDPDII